MDENTENVIVETELPETCRIGLDKKKAKRAATFLKIAGIVAIITGAPQLFAIFTLPVGVLMILSGVKLFTAGGQLKSACNGNEASSTYAGDDLAKAVKYGGIGLLINLVEIVLGLLLDILIISAIGSMLF